MGPHCFPCHDYLLMWFRAIITKTTSFVNIFMNRTTSELAPLVGIEYFRQGAGFPAIPLRLNDAYYRLAWLRTAPFHGDEWGSNPLGAVSIFKRPSANAQGAFCLGDCTQSRSTALFVPLQFTERSLAVVALQRGRVVRGQGRQVSTQFRQ